MRLSERKLRRIVKEEISRVLREDIDTSIRADEPYGVDAKGGYTVSVTGGPEAGRLYLEVGRGKVEDKVELSDTDALKLSTEIERIVGGSAGDHRTVNGIELERSRDGVFLHLPNASVSMDVSAAKRLADLLHSKAA